MIRPTVKNLAFVILLFSGLVILFMSLASTPDYRALFWSVLPFALVHMALAVFFFMHASAWEKGFLVVFSSLALISFIDLTMRISLHFSLLSWLLSDVLRIAL
jgi:hypothetical protein